MCELACPVEINTGELVKRFRHQQHSPRAEQIGREVAERYAAVEQAFRVLLRTAHATAKIATHRPLVAATDLLRAAVSADLMPRWDPTMPPAAPPLPATAAAQAAAVYFPACVNRIFGPGEGEARHPTLPEALVAVSARAGLPVVIPDDVAGACCGTPWHSKGYFEGMQLMANRTAERAWWWSSEGSRPIVVDATSCTSGLRTCREYLSPDNAERFDRMTFLDSIDWLQDLLLPRLQVTAKVGSVAVHAVCSAYHISAVGKLEAIGAALAEEVVNPPQRCSTRWRPWRAGTTRTTSAATGPARSGCLGRPASRTARSCLRWRPRPGPRPRPTRTSRRRTGCRSKRPAAVDDLRPAQDAADALTVTGADRAPVMVSVLPPPPAAARRRGWPWPGDR